MNSTRKWRIFTTSDGSPTLIWSGEGGYEEKMHHSGGALAESLFIYQNALREVLHRGWPARVLSLGLGLGYNELIACAELLRTRATDWKIWSFEAETSLREGFGAWLEGKTVELSEIYNDILKRISESQAIDKDDLFSYVQIAYREGRLELRGAFPAAAGGVEACSCIFYDAYSKKMDSDLWDEQVLSARLQPLLSSQCVLATYAATGAMNRTLKALGFRLIPRVGFLGKRESTLAIRE